MEKDEWVEKLGAEGYTDVTVHTFPHHMDFAEHTHDQHTVHVILEGEFTLFEKDGEKVLKQGDRFEIPAGTTHSAKAGPHGVTFVVGVKK